MSSVLQGATITIPASSVFPVSSTAASSGGASGNGVSATHFVVPAGDIFSTPTNGLILTSSTPLNGVTSVASPLSNLVTNNVQKGGVFINSSMVPSPSASSTTSVDSGRHRDLPPSLSIETASPVSNHDNNNPPVTMDFADNLSNALNDFQWDMEWTNTDFLTSPNLFGEVIDSKKENLFTPPPLSITPVSTSSNSSTSGSNVTAGDNKRFDINTGGDITLPPTEPMSEDVTAWLDAIMPSSGLTPLSSTTPASCSGDSVLTPKPQDILDLFSMDETDLCSASPELSLSASGLDKVLDSTSTHS